MVWMCLKNVKIGVIIQLKDQYAPFMIDVHCMNHHTSLTIQTFLKSCIVGKIKDVNNRHIEWCLQTTIMHNLMQEMLAI
jgi:hypothetical protein